MLKKMLVGAFLLGLSLSPQAAAQDQAEVEAKNLPQGVSLANARRLLKAGESSSERDLKVIHARRERQMRQVSAITAGARAALKRVLDADKTGVYKNYQADMERVRKLSGKERINALRELEAKYLSFFQNAFKEAKINEADLQARIARIFPGAKFGPLLTATGREPSEPEDEADDPKAHASPQNTQTFDAPYGIRSTKKTKQGIAGHVLNASAKLDDGYLSAGVIILFGIGSGRATAALGQAVNVSSGFRDIRATVKIDADYSLFAESVLLNTVAGSWVDAIIEIDKPNGVRRKRVHNLGWVVAPVLWVASISGEDEPLSLSKKVSVPGSNGGEFQIKARMVAEAYTYGATGVSDGSVYSKLKTITVQSIP